MTASAAIQAVRDFEGNQSLDVVTTEDDEGTWTVGRLSETASHDAWVETGPGSTKTDYVLLDGSPPYVVFVTYWEDVPSVNSSAPNNPISEVQGQALAVQFASAKLPGYSSFQWDILSRAEEDWQTYSFHPQLASGADTHLGGCDVGVSLESGCLVNYQRFDALPSGLATQEPTLTAEDAISVAETEYPDLGDYTPTCSLVVNAEGQLVYELVYDLSDEVEYSAAFPSILEVDAGAGAIVFEDASANFGACPPPKRPHLIHLSIVVACGLLVLALAAVLLRRRAKH